METTDFRDMDILEAKSLLLKEGKISIALDKKYATRFRSCSRRIDNLEKLLRERGLFKRVWYYLYAIYTSVINTALILNEQALDQAVHVYMVSWEYLGQVHAEPIGGERINIVFRGQNAASKGAN